MYILWWQSTWIVYYGGGHFEYLTLKFIFLCKIKGNDQIIYLVKHKPLCTMHMYLRIQLVNIPFPMFSYYGGGHFGLFTLQIYIIW